MRPLTSASADVRATQLAQLQRRFRSSFLSVSDDAQRSIVRIAISPSDPDFPYELEALQLQISIPSKYPEEHCQVSVMNTDIPKGFAFNLEKAYEGYAKQSSKTLVQQMGWLDRNMETVLQQPPAPTMRFISHSPKPIQGSLSPLSTPSPAHINKTPPQPTAHSSALSADAAVFVPKIPTVEPSSQQTITRDPNANPKPSPKSTPKPKPSRRRQKELSQLQSRFGAGYRVISSNANDTVVGLSIKLNDPDLPVEQMENLRIKYCIPIEYPSKPCNIILDVPMKESKAKMIADAFSRHCKDAKHSLFENLNWLNRNFATLETKTPVEVASTPLTDEPQHHSPPPPQQSSQPPTSPSSSSNTPVLKEKKMVGWFDEGEMRKSHVITTTAPDLVQPITNSVGASRSQDSYSDDSDSDVEVIIEPPTTNEKHTATLDAVTPPATIRRGTEIRLLQPLLENVSLFRCTLLRVMVKCAKCKGAIDVENIQPVEQGADEQTSSEKNRKERWMTCPTCSSVVGIKFIGELVHQSASSIGVLQLAGCNLFDLLPSQFMGTCGKCMDDMRAPVRLMPGASPTTTNCASCHARMTVGLGDFTFVKIGDGGDRLRADEAQVMKLKLKPKKKRDDVQLTIGEPLPNHGTCAHLRRSKRWFRFTCCGKLYACSDCHDSEEDHEWKMARRHVCGQCSREQAVGKECVCGHEFEKSHKGAFWEGGQGVRNRTTMSRKDPHKHRGLSKKASKKQERVGGHSQK